MPLLAVIALNMGWLVSSVGMVIGTNAVPTMIFVALYYVAIPALNLTAAFQLGKSPSALLWPKWTLFANVAGILVGLLLIVAGSEISLIGVLASVASLIYISKMKPKSVTAKSPDENILIQQRRTISPGNAGIYKIVAAVFLGFCASLWALFQYGQSETLFIPTQEWLEGGLYIALLLATVPAACMIYGLFFRDGMRTDGFILFVNIFLQVLFAAIFSHYLWYALVEGGGAWLTATHGEETAEVIHVKKFVEPKDNKGCLGSRNFSGALFIHSYCNMTTQEYNALPETADLAFKGQKSGLGTLIEGFVMPQAAPLKNEKMGLDRMAPERR